MPLHIVVLIVIGIGVLMYFFNQYFKPIDPTFKQIVNVVVVIAVVLWLLSFFVSLPNIPWGTRR